MLNYSVKVDNSNCLNSVPIPTMIVKETDTGAILVPQDFSAPVPFVASDFSIKNCIQSGVPLNDMSPIVPSNKIQLADKSSKAVSHFVKKENID